MCDTELNSHLTEPPLQKICTHTQKIAHTHTEVIIAWFHDSSATTFLSLASLTIWIKMQQQFGIYLQNEDKVVDGFVSLEEVVLRSVFALRVELEFLHNGGMFDET